MNIDELTEPRPQDPRFFADLSDRIIDIGLAAGLRSSDAGRIKQSLNDIGNRHANYITEGRVREFVKEAAELVARNVAPADIHGKPI